MTSRSQLYPLARQAFATAALNWPTINCKLALMTSAYSPNFANQYLSDVSSANIIATSGNITGLTATNGYLSGNTTSFGVIDSPLEAGSIIFYQDTGDPTTSLLLAFLDTPDIQGLPQILDGLQYFLYQNLAYGGWFRL